MAEPSVRFFAGPTGHRVAYAEHGDGPPLVCSAWWVSHVTEDWSDTSFRGFFTTLGEHFRVYRYDRPGSGLSDRDRDRVELGDEVATLEAFVEHLGLARCSVFAVSCGGPPAIRLAVRRPGLVERLVLFGSYAEGRDVGNAKIQAAVREMVGVHWGLGATMITDLFAPNLSVPQRQSLTRSQRAAATPEMAAELLRLTFEASVGEYARELDVPALVLHRRGDRTIPFSAGRDLAAVLPNAIFRPLEGAEHVPWLGDAAAVTREVVDFLAPKATQESTRRYALVRQGDVWELTFGGDPVYLKHARGFEDLAALLAAPGEEIHVSALQTSVTSEPTTRMSDLIDPILDDAALSSYRKRLREIEAKLGGATGRVADRLRSERDAITKELRRAVGLHGRTRKLDPSVERARKAVASRLKTAVQKIADVSPAAGVHFDRYVATGTYCSYAPPEPLRWELG